MRAGVVVVGGGPSGLTAAAELARAGAGPVVVVERETAAGGIPRHSDHLGFGVRDLHRVLSGPGYARRLVGRAAGAGVSVRTGAMVTDVGTDRSLWVTSAGGREQLGWDALVLATGARERGRAARLVPGDRGAGVYTTGQLQDLVHLHRRAPGTRAVVVGAELVSWSAVLTLRTAGCRTVAMLSRHERPESFALLAAAGRAALRTPVLARTRLVAIHGRPRVEAVEVEDLAQGTRRLLRCDTVVLTGDWIPDNELARSLGLALDPASRAPLVDAAGRTTAAGVFAVGNLTHPVDTADVAALGGRHVAAAVLRRLAGGGWPAARVPLVAEAPLRWVAPGFVDTADRTPARHRLICWTDEHVARPRVTVTQGERVLARVRLPWAASPGRAFRVPSGVLRRVAAGDGPVTVGLR